MAVRDHAGKMKKVYVHTGTVPVPKLPPALFYGALIPALRVIVCGKIPVAAR